MLKIFIPVLMLLAGCTEHLTKSTVDLSSSTSDLYTQQVLEDISRTIDNPWSIPSQNDITEGSSQVISNIGPTGSFSIGDSIAQGGALGVSENFSQSWKLVPVDDTRQLRTIRSLYRYALFGTSDPSAERAIRALYRGKPAMFYWTSPSGGVPPRLPEEGVQTVKLGKFGSHTLLVKASDYGAGYVQELVLAVMATDEKSGASPGSRQPRSVSPAPEATPGSGQTFTAPAPFFR